jgi:hypothetical protein
VNEVRRIATEKLIVTFAAENNLHLSTRGAREEECRKHCRISDGLRDSSRHILERIEKRLFIDAHRHMPRPHPRRHPRRIAALVVRRLGELRRKRMHLVDADRL